MVSAHGGPGVASVRSRRRSRQAVGRVRSVRFGLTEEEFDEVGAAAAEAGLAKGAYAAQATLAAARGRMNPADSPFRQALTELIRAAGLVRRIGVNVFGDREGAPRRAPLRADPLPVRAREA